MSAPSRPVLRYHGGKWRLAPWIVSHFPAHRVYVEPFGGAASVLLRKPRSYAEVYNDLDGEVVNLFRVLRDAALSARLCEAVRLTPFARQEFDEAYESSEDSVERARRLVVRGFMGFGSAAATRDHKTGFRSNVTRSGTTPAMDWMRWPESVGLTTERLRGVVIESREATAVVRQYDDPATLHYVDPPYTFGSRSLPRGASSPFAYRHEMTDDDHRALAATLQVARGMVVLSGYGCDLYDRELYPTWQRVEKETHADGASDRTEVLWLNPATTAALANGNLFQETP